VAGGAFFLGVTRLNWHGTFSIDKKHAIGGARRSRAT